ncbi:DUF3822 family protein [Cytophaga hutchinsonii]|jgi:hypothetical protein|uniref:DUF3822 domain-containing protein n=1 Tax=Cytophaga hutchinsonii (strain ATCC 33406 / DSM 1761 / CIP 103989 / NBRC 15051 / NCIMB 9469 / D465) TaxID=269798 RepID=A0A6N4SU52_CYTH3|nr:DUF3822 family protein [Cytophaga hutchinsonii]ABG59918.1 conserved hypothetical protein [Cytophaga hutchinsonii ATCC 33406]SFX27423.1 Protein of unknown function [Cytophaga hutchinsonii ATCC 33406]
MLSDITVRYKLNNSIKDSRFETEHLAKYHLSFQVNFELFRICIVDGDSNRCLFLEDYTLADIYTTNDLLEQLDILFEDHILIKAGFWKSITVGFKNTQFSLIPEALFEKDYLKEYLTLNTTLDREPDEEYHFYKQRQTEAVNVFATNQRLTSWFNKTYPLKQVRYVHHTASMIEGIMLQKDKNAAEKSVFIQVEQYFLTIIVKQGKKLIFCNSFTFNTSEDFVYFILFVFDQLELNPEKCPVVVFGEITHDSESFSKLYKYIRHLTFGSKPEFVRFGYQFDEVFDHRYFDLYNMHLCQG